MGNSNSGESGPPSPALSTGSTRDSASKQVHITTDHPNGFYFTGENLIGTVKIPSSLIQHSQQNNRTPTDLLNKRSLRSAIAIELVGNASYSAECDAAADSDGHATHNVNVCRQRCLVTLNNNEEKSTTIRNENEAETSFEQTPITTASDRKPAGSTTPPAVLTGTFQLQIPHNLPPSLANVRAPTVIYTLELRLSSSRHRYQIPVTLSSHGQPRSNPLELRNNAINQHDIRLRASLPQNSFRPGEQIPVHVNYNNPQQRFIRSVKVTLIQFHRVHNDLSRVQLDGREWTFDVSTMAPMIEWQGEARLQLPGEPLPASYASQFVGTTTSIYCEVDYRIFVELNEKKGDDIQLSLSPINVTYES